MRLSNTIILITLLFLYETCSFSQNSILSSGNEINTSNGSVSYSIGQTFYSSFSDVNNSVTEGVQQVFCEIPNVLSTTPASRCGSGGITISAIPSLGTIKWYLTEEATEEITSNGSFTVNGNDLVIQNLIATTTFYVEAVNGNCVSGRIGVVASLDCSSKLINADCGRALTYMDERLAFN